MAEDRNIQSPGRKANAAQPLDAAKDKGGPERYPPVRQDDSVEPAGERNPQPRQGAGDGGVPRSPAEGRLGPAADPAEGKRED